MKEIANVIREIFSNGLTVTIRMNSPVNAVDQVPGKSQAIHEKKSKVISKRKTKPVIKPVKHPPRTYTTVEGLSYCIERGAVICKIPRDIPAELPIDSLTLMLEMDRPTLAKFLNELYSYRKRRAVYKLIDYIQAGKLTIDGVNPVIPARALSSNDAEKEELPVLPEVYEPSNVLPKFITPTKPKRR